jgi:hypothetical protein
MRKVLGGQRLLDAVRPFPHVFHGESAKSKFFLGKIQNIFLEISPDFLHEKMERQGSWPNDEVNQGV